MLKLLAFSLLAATPALAQSMPSAAADAATIAAQARALPLPFAHESGVVLDGLAAQWQATADGQDFVAIKAAVDRWVAKDGTLTLETPFDPAAHSLDTLELGRAILLCYRVTLDQRYYRAAKFLYGQFDTQPRTPEGGFWHQQKYPQQVWLDGAYMAEPFRAAYAATFQDTAAFDDIAHQLLLMHDRLRDPKTGLLRHGWDSSRQQPWADKQTGRSPEAWSRAVGWYAMALADTLPWFPESHKDRAALIEAFRDVAGSIEKTQQPGSGLWLNVLSEPASSGNVEEASASAMFVYALAKGVRLGYLPANDEGVAERGWKGIEARFVTRDAAGGITLHGTVKARSLGGTKGPAGEDAHSVKDRTVDNDAKGIGAYLLAASEMQQASAAGLARGKTVLLDAWFNSQTRKNAAGQTELFHYKWNDDANSGFAFFGRAFQRFGAKLSELPEAPTRQNLRDAKVYVIVSPDIPVKNPTPHYMDKASADEVEAWVRAGGVLLLLENDPANADIDHLNLLSERFGIHYNKVLRNKVQGTRYEQGQLNVTANEVFPEPLKVYMKEICTMTVSGSAKPLFVDAGDTLMAVAHVGKGVVFATVDPWLYNEYTDGQKLAPEFKDFEAAIALARWSLSQPK